MASGSYQRNVVKMLDGTIAYLTDTIKMLLVSTATAYTYDPDHEFVDAGGANDIIDAEANVTNYTRGYGGAGRKTLASKTMTNNDTSNRVELDCADVTWTALGGASNQTLAAAVVLKEGAANDTTSRMFAYLDFTDTATNGGDITVQIATNGFLNFTMV